EGREKQHPHPSVEALFRLEDAGGDGGDVSLFRVGADRSLDHPSARVDRSGVGTVAARVVAALLGGFPQRGSGGQRLVEIVVAQAPGREGIAASFSLTQAIQVSAGD